MKVVSNGQVLEWATHCRRHVDHQKSGKGWNSPHTSPKKKKTKQPLNLAHIANEVHFIAFSYFLFSLFQGLQTGFLLEATVD